MYPVADVTAFPAPNGGIYLVSEDTPRQFPTALLVPPLVVSRNIELAGTAELLECSPQAGHLDQGDVANDVQIDAEVIVDQNVAHPGDLTPRNLRRPVAERTRHALGGFSENLEVANDGVDRLSVTAEGGRVEGLRVVPSTGSTTRHSDAGVMSGCQCAAGGHCPSRSALTTLFEVSSKRTPMHDLITTMRNWVAV